MKILEQLKQQYQSFVDQKLNLDMTRGKPSPQQLSLSDRMLDNLTKEYVLQHSDCRNYSIPSLLTGLPEMRDFFAKIIDMPSDNIIIGGNSSLNMMYDTMLRAMFFALPHSKQSWSQQGKVKFICPTPGYDRHFNICEAMGIEMITVPMTGNGPDMSQVKALVANDPSIKGIWCVPQYSNPTGETYSDEVVEALASMPTASQDFRIFWDNAYALHDLDTQDVERVANIYSACQRYDHANRVFIFASTSKVTYAGGGVAMVAMSDENLSWFKQQMAQQTIGYDKINQLRHLALLPDMSTLTKHMQAHALILKPKFEMVDKVLTDMLGNDGQYAQWRLPKGGYFISFETQPHCAQRVVELASQAGVKLTKAGATFPYGKDPMNSNIRIAPSLPSVEDIEKATTILALATQIATLEQNEK